MILLLYDDLMHRRCRLRSSMAQGVKRAHGSRIAAPGAKQGRSDCQHYIRDIVYGANDGIITTLVWRRNRRSCRHRQ
jgi:hypothetical protein